MSFDEALRSLGRFVGAWTTEATHPALPGVVVHGTVDVEWLEGQRFLIHRARTDHPQFPDSISIIGSMERDRVGDEGEAGRVSVGKAQLTMHYYDSRGVFRDFAVAVDDASLRFERLASGFSQRFIGTFADGGKTLAGRWQLSRDDVRWDDDLAITYRRRA